MRTKRIIAGAMLAGAGAIAFALPAQAAAACGQPAAPATYADTKVVDRAATPGSPAVPAVEGTPAVPAVEEVSHVETRVVKEAWDMTVVDREAYTTTDPGPWWVWAPSDYQGPQDFVPAFPEDGRGKWIGPKTKGGPERTAEGTFNVSNGNSGNSSWFHRGPTVVTEHPAETHVVHHDAVTEDVKVVDVSAKPAVPAKPGTPGVPAVPATDEVSHVERVLVTEAVPAGPACGSATPASKPRSPRPPAELAFTGSETAPLTAIAGVLLLAGAGAIRARRLLG